MPLNQKKTNVCYAPYVCLKRGNVSDDDYMTSAVEGTRKWFEWLAYCLVPRERIVSYMKRKKEEENLSLNPISQLYTIGKRILTVVSTYNRNPLWLKTIEYPKSFDFNYRICKLSSELHHSFLPDFSFPICFYPLFFLNICKNKKNETKTLESFSNTTTTTGLSRVLYYITQQTSAASNYLSLDREEEVPNIVEGIQTSKPNDSQTVD